jgi:hypothetical protein
VCSAFRRTLPREPFARRPRWHPADRLRRTCGLTPRFGCRSSTASNACGRWVSTDRRLVAAWPGRGWSPTTCGSSTSDGSSERPLAVVRATIVCPFEEARYVAQHRRIDHHTAASCETSAAAFSKTHGGVWTVYWQVYLYVYLGLNRGAPRWEVWQCWRIRPTQ